MTDAALILLIALVSLFAAHDCADRKDKLKRFAPWIKGCCTVICLAAFLTHIPENGCGLPVMIFASALALCVAADVAICFNFNAGVALFGLGHLFYSAAFLLPGFRPLLFAVCFAAIFSAMLLLILKWGLLKKKNPLYAAYMILLAAMVSLAAGRGIPVFIGAAAFAASDMTLVYNRNLPKSELVDRANLGLYFAAQFILAISFK
jgi:hypothetical protein